MPVMEIILRKQFIIFLLFFCGWGFFSAPAAQAHRVNVFAWVEGNTIYTSAKFSGGKVAKTSRVEVFDSQKQLLLKGKTDDQGNFSFPVPKVDDLKIVVYAGTGHLGNWQVKKSELTTIGKLVSSAAAPTSAPETATAAATAARPSPAANSGTVSNSTVNLNVSPAEIEKIVQKVVNKSLTEKLHPLMQMLAEIRNPDPGLKDVLGGLGYILGLVGIIAYIKSRKQPPATKRDL